MQKNPFLKYVMKDNKEDIFHSSAYAKAQNGGGIGAASSESYQVRVKINENRQNIKGYGDSEIMSGLRNQMPKAAKDAASARPMMPPKNPGISLKK